MNKRFFVMTARNGYKRYFEYEGEGFPVLDIFNAQDYNIYEVSEEEYKKNKKYWL